MQYLIFTTAVIIFLLWCLLRTGKKPDVKIKFDRERIVAHRDKKTLIIPEGEPAKDETQALYFATGKDFVNESKV